MEKINIKEIIKQNEGVDFPDGVCCANRCSDCRYMEMDNNAYNDGTRRCAYYGKWLSPATPACPNFKY
ncbi:MAG: hypothetical protein IJZ34_10220 [Lachnospiraceae bacterium]|nr:hypothetical protein [Lachnospiraceae bacterium]